MKVIFLDFNGVLDTYDDMNIIDTTNLNILKEIIEITDAKIVISSSIKNTYFYCGKHNKVMEYLIEEFDKNNIEIYGMTPFLETREEEIIKYLDEHQEITEFCIIDDDFFFESMREYMIKLKPQLRGGNGLKEIDKNIIINILNKKRIKIKYKKKVYDNSCCDFYL